MKKKLLAVAVVGALASPAAFAQTLYGVMDVGYQNAKFADGDVNKHFVQNGMATGSRLGVRGSEDLAQGLTAIYVIELEVTADVGTVGTPGRQTYVGLDSKAWGALTLGRQYTHTFHTFEVGQAGPYDYGTFSSFYGATGISTRANNAIKYSSPLMSGFSVGALWAPGEDTTPGESNNGAYLDAAIRYTPGPLGVSLSHTRTTVELAGTENVTKMNQITAGWDTGPFGVLGGYITAENDGAVAGVAALERDAYWVNGVARFGGRHEFHALWGKVKNDLVANGDATVIGVVYQHVMSKRTRIYTGFGRVSNDAGSAVVPTGFASAVGAGYDPRGFQLGLATSF